MIKKILICFAAITTIFASAANYTQAREIVEMPHWEKAVINIYIPEKSDKKTVSILKRAFSQWQIASGGRINFEYVDKGPADIDVIFSESASGYASPISRTSITVSDHVISKAEISIASESKQYKNYNDKYLTNVFLHETGNALGVPDNTTKKSSIMYTPVTEEQHFMKKDALKLFSVSGWSYSKRKINNK